MTRLAAWNDATCASRDGPQCRQYPQSFDDSCFAIGMVGKDAPCLSSLSLQSLNQAAGVSCLDEAEV